LLLPERVRDPARALYAFCRVADDAVDKAQGGPAAIVELRDRLAGIYEGRTADDPCDRAFADVAHRFAIPRSLPEALIEGFSWDVDGMAYENYSNLVAYAVRVAGTVGAMMSVIMGVRSAEAIARACDLGVAMQLTNIARDVGDDARLGRIYLPHAWLRDAGVDPASWLSSPAYSPAIGSVVARLLVEADKLYARANAGITLLPAACRPAIHAARALYSEIGREVERRGLDSVNCRAVVTRKQKLLILTGAFAMAFRTTESAPLPPLAEAKFLVDAVAHGPRPHQRPSGFDAGAAWVVDLFTRLESQRL
jgi:phytoene synthase